MDAIDRKLLAELDRNPRTPLTRLARKIRVSQQVADYRMKKLMEEGTLAKMVPIINLKALKQEHYRIFFKFNAVKEYKPGDILKWLGEQKGIYWAARIGGRYDFLVVLFVFDFAAFDSFIGRFNARFPGLVRDYTALYGIDHFVYRHKYMSKSYEAIWYGYNDKPQDIDELDMKILREFKENCRLSSVDIAKKTGVSYKTIINRIKEMEKRNVILGYRIFIHSGEKLPFIILLSFKNYSKEAEKKLVAYLERTDSVTQVVRLFGSWSLFIHAREESNEKLQQLVIDLRDKFEIIADYEIIPIFSDIAIDMMPL